MNPSISNRMGSRVLKQFAQVTPPHPALVHAGELKLDSFGVKRAKGLAPGARLTCSSHRGAFVPRPAPRAVAGRSPEVCRTWTSCAQHLLLCSLKSLLAPVDSASKIATIAAALTIKR